MTSHDNVTDIELFAGDVTGVQSRIVICHQLLASADIQDKQTKAETGWADTNDRAELMRKAASTIATLRKQLENAREALRQCRNAVKGSKDEPRRNVREIVDEALGQKTTLGGELANQYIEEQQQ